MLVKFLIALGGLYHVLATAVAMMSVVHFMRMLRGVEVRDPLWRRLHTQAEVHLWVSGVLLVALGMYATGWAKYLDNPKLWTKVCLVTLWSLNSWWMKRHLARASETERLAMFGISLGSLLYGSFLGVAKPLAYGEWPFVYFLGGYAMTVLVCAWAMLAWLRQLRAVSTAA